MAQITERIKKVRKDNNLSQDAFANILSVHRGHISKIETGAANPSQSLTLKICLEFDISWDWLNEGTGAMKSTWGPKELTDLIKAALVHPKPRSLIIIVQAVLIVLEHYLKIIRCLGKDASRLIDPAIKPGDPIIVEIVEDILEELRKKGIKKPEGMKSLVDLNNIEGSTIKILRVINKVSLKDFYLFLASKANRLDKKQREELKKDIAILKKASK